MKRILSVVAMALICLAAIAQVDDPDLVLFIQGNALAELASDDLEVYGIRKDLDSAEVGGKMGIQVLDDIRRNVLEKSLEHFEDLLQDYPESEFRFKALNNAASVSWRLNEHEKAIKYYKAIMESEADDMEEGGVGEGIMADPYAMYKNRACKNLAELYLNNKKYEEALKYIDLTGKYPYQHFCGNAYAADEIYIAMLYTRSYKGLGDDDRALEVSLPNVFDNGFADNREIYRFAVDLIRSKYSNTEIQDELKRAATTIKIKKNKRQEYAVINIFDQELILPDADMMLYRYDNVSEYGELNKLSGIEKSGLVFEMTQFYKDLSHNNQW